MKPTQNNNQGGEGPPKIPRMPRRYTPDIQKIGTPKPENGAKKPTEQKTVPAKRRPPAPKKRKKRKRKTIFGAILDELTDRLDGLSIGIPFTASQILRGVICCLLIVFFAMLQTTVFARFKPFGAVPDLMFALTVAIAFSEGEKWGGLCGIIAAVVIDALGSVGISVLPILYMAEGVLCGYLVRDFFSNTALPRIAVITLFTVFRSVVTLIMSTIMVDAPITDIIFDIVIPEYFSTVLMSAPVYLAVWLCFFKFHKTRAERTTG